MSKHTPGPWVFHHNGDNHHIGAILGNGGEGDAVCDFGDGTDYYPTEGTAPEKHDLALILAAPDLYAALELTRGNVASLHASHPNVWGHWLAVINAVLAKATKEPT